MNSVVQQMQRRNRKQRFLMLDHSNEIESQLLSKINSLQKASSVIRTYLLTGKQLCDLGIIVPPKVERVGTIVRISLWNEERGLLNALSCCESKEEEILSLKRWVLAGFLFFEHPNVVNINKDSPKFDVPAIHKSSFPNKTAPTIPSGALEQFSKLGLGF